MTRDDIIRMAQEAGLLNQTAPGVIWSCPVPSDDYPDRIERFAALVAVAEREACAIAGGAAAMAGLDHLQVAAEIRARGEA